MRVVHFSTNSLAGMPLRLVRGLDRCTGIQARLVDLERYSQDQSGWFEHDVVFRETPELAVRLAEEADVLHLHNYLDLDSREFAPLDFRRLQQRGKLVLRQFHSIPEMVALRMNVPLKRVLDCSLPALVINHYPERFYPQARVVPNFVPQDEPAYCPPGADAALETDLFFSPSKLTGAWENRWNTKGAPEVQALMERLSRETGCRCLTLHGRPLAEVLRRRRLSRIVLDDMGNGSMHLSGLEGVSQGKPVCAYLDERQLRVLAEMAGTTSHPFCNVRLEEAAPVLRHLLAAPGEAREMGLEARQWLERYYTDRLLAGHYVQAYEDLARCGTLERQKALRLDRPLARFQAVELPELRWRERAARNGLDS
ncbi:MAG: glycosyltransferase family 1 protein [Desulfovibrio sp.]